MSSTLRALPARPSLEFEHKEAKALYRRLKAGDPEALARARERHPEIETRSPATLKLADAQLVIAREYGFASWPKLVRYFRDMERALRTPRQAEVRVLYDGMVRSLLAEHRAREAWAARALAAYVPRFYGAPVAELRTVSITESDARQAIARMYGFATWDTLVAANDEPGYGRKPKWEMGPAAEARDALNSADLEALKRVVAAHPSLLEPRDAMGSRRRTLLLSALHAERRNGVEAMRPIMEWLGTQGFDLQRELNMQLCFVAGKDAEHLRYLLRRGADPNWVAPNGIPVLEHALIGYRNAETVDILAAHARPRRALWIAAGLGDVEGVSRFLDKSGRPTRAARRLRPDFGAVGLGAQHPDPDDEEILMEAFLIAMVNRRIQVLDYMISRGFPVNSRVYDMTPLHFAVGNAMKDVVECLLHGGADPDIRGMRPAQTPREMARERFENAGENANLRRIVELCGMDPDAILAARNARPLQAPGIHPLIGEAMTFAQADAVREGHAVVGVESFVVGLLRVSEDARSLMTVVSRLDAQRFGRDFDPRIRSTSVAGPHTQLPVGAELQAAIDAAVARGTERRRDLVHMFHVLRELLRDERGTLARLVARYGGSREPLVAYTDAAC